MQIHWKKEILPHIYAVLIFLGLSVAFCYPSLNSQVIRQHDMMQYQAMSHEAREAYKETKEPPLWANNMFSGMPTYITYTGPNANKATLIHRITTLWLPRPVSLLFLAMLGVYFLLCVLGFGFGVSVFGAAAYGFSSYNPIIIVAGHMTKILTMAWMAPLLAGVILIYRKKYVVGGLVTAMSSMLLIFQNHIQIIYYTALLILVFAIWKFILALKEKKLKSFLLASAIALVAGFAGLLPSLPQLIATNNYSQYSIRGSQSELTLKENQNQQIKKGGLDIDYAFQWSLGKLETFSILIPNIYGGPAHSEDFHTQSETYTELTSLGAQPQQAANISQAAAYWGPQPFTTPIYFGALICFLFILSFFLIKDTRKWWLVAVTGLSFLMAWGNHLEAFNSFLFNNLPLFNKFRTPSMIMIIPQLTFVILGCWALHHLLEEKTNKKEALKALKKTLYVSAGILLFAWIAVGGLLEYTGAGDENLAQQLGEQVMDRIRGSIHADRASLFKFDALRSLGFILAAFLVLWAFLKDKLNIQRVTLLLGVLLFLDLFVLDRRYMNKENFVPRSEIEVPFQASEADRQILADPDPDFRMVDLSGGLSNIFNNASPSYFHKNIGGYSPAKLWVYQDLIDHQLSPALQNIYTVLQQEDENPDMHNLFGGSPVLNMLNTKYFILNPNGTPVMNPEALGNAWFVDQIHWAKDANEEMNALSSFDPKTTAILNEKYQADIEDPAKDSAGSIRLTKYGLNKMEYESENSTIGFGVFSEIYYPEWKAYVDGEETPIYQVNYALRGIEIPSGKHEIVFEIHPKSFYSGRKLAGISSTVLVLLIVLGLGWQFYESHKDKRSEIS